MDKNIVSGKGRGLKGWIKQNLGSAIGDRSLKIEGIAEQAGGKVQALAGSARDRLAKDAPLVTEKASRFLRNRPIASAAALGVVALAIVGALRGRR